MDPEPLTPDLTLLEVLSRWRQTEAVFRRYEQQAGVCLLCKALFDTLAEAAAKYGLDLEQLLGELQAVADASGGERK
jgi:hypothetical protein